MQVLSYGFKNPDNGDKGSLWFPALNFNIVQLNNHNHDGVTSSLIPASNISAGSVTILSANWTLVSTGKYTQSVSLPAGFLMATSNMQIRNANGDYIYPSIVQTSTTAFNIYTNDNTQTYTAVFR
jgi:hypothetical protein